MKVNRLGQKMVESRLSAEFTILIRCPSGQCDGLHHGQTSLRLRHQLECVAIGQADIAQQDFKRHFPEEIGGFCQIAGNGDHMPAVNQKLRDYVPALAVVL